MDKKSNIYCLFEQSSTFKNAFKRAGFKKVIDVDIKNDFGETDEFCNIFDDVELYYTTGNSPLMGSITKNDFIMAFFPCIYFSQFNCLYFTGKSNVYNGLSECEKINKIIERAESRQYFYDILLKFCWIVMERQIPCIIENPYSGANHYLYNNFPFEPKIIDLNRNLRGDYYKKPTQYFCLNFEPTKLNSIQKKYKAKTINGISGHKFDGTCNVERSLISPEYAENFINDYILGKKTERTERTLFN